MSNLVLTRLSKEKLAELLSILRQELSTLLGDRLEAIYLYGSQARGEAQPGSDIDVLVVLRGNFDYFDMVKQTSYITAELSLEYETVISCVFATKERYEQRQTPLLINIRREGILI